MKRTEALEKALDYFRKDTRIWLDELIIHTTKQFRLGEITEEKFKEILQDPRYLTYNILTHTDITPMINSLVKSTKKEIEKEQEIPKEILKWYFWEYNPSGPSNYEIYKRNHAILTEQYKFLDIGGYYPATNQGQLSYPVTGISQ
jgi:sulfur relay (sulfurtransferase) DsrC/TusE family protein